MSRFLSKNHRSGLQTPLSAARGPGVAGSGRRRPRSGLIATLRKLSHWPLLLLALAGPVLAQSLDLTRGRIAGGGGTSGGGQFTLFSTVG